MRPRLTRYELNQMVKAVLVRFAVDLRALEFSCTGHSVYFKGELLKDPHGDFTAPEVMAMVNEIERFPVQLRIDFELDNWRLTPGFGAWDAQPVGAHGVSTGTPGGSPASGDTTLIIDDDDTFDSLIIDDIPEE